MKKAFDFLLITVIFLMMLVSCSRLNMSELNDSTSEQQNILNSQDASITNSVNTNDLADSSDQITAENQESTTSYTLFLYDNTLSGTEDTITPRTDVRLLQTYDVKTNDVDRSKTITLFGEMYTLEHIGTQGSIQWKDNYALYKGVDANGWQILASFNTNTGALMTFSKNDSGCDRSYKSEVNGNSSESEFVEYAKKMISQYASVEGCEVEIHTELYQYDKRYDCYTLRKHGSGFVNNTENALDFYAIYRFTFYKMIDGIRRYDVNRICIHENGEVSDVLLLQQNELYASFLDMKIDMKQATLLVENAVENNGARVVEIQPSLIATNDGAIWLYLATRVSFGDGGGGYYYAINLSEAS